MNQPKRTIPEKFQNVEKSFIQKILSEEEQSPFSSFQAFPKRYNFYGKDPGEEVVLVVRTHWIAFLPHLLTVLLLLVLPILLFVLSGGNPFLGSPTLYLGVIILSFAIASSVVVTAIVKWYYTVSIVTDKRIVVMNVANVFIHTYSEAQLEKVEDITHKHVGVLGNFLNVGDVLVDTAGHEIDFSLRLLPRPRDLQDVMNDLLVLKQKGKI
jgi:hypothetical protein